MAGTHLHRADAGPRVEDRSRSIWLDTSVPDPGQLSGDVACDVCVVGGGIAGLLVAERLHNDGLKVTVLDAGRMLHGETGHTTAHFTSALDDRYTDLEKKSGVVRWNNEETTWDCPCHASRFDRFGKVMHGPANSDLKPAEE